MKRNTKKKETRSIVVYGYKSEDIKKIIEQLKPDFAPNLKVSSKTAYGLSTITIEGSEGGIELLRFNVSKTHRLLCEYLKDGILSTEDKTLSEILGTRLIENELTISTAESCTGGNIANRIVQNAGSSAYFLGSVVSYSNQAKAEILSVSRQILDEKGAVSKETTEAMVEGISNLMHSDCAIAISGIAGPSGGSKEKPVGTVWITVKCQDNTHSECSYFKGNRNDIMEAATTKAIVMMISFIKEKFTLIEESNDE